MNHDDHPKKHGRHHGIIMNMFRHYHGMIMARSWHDKYVFPTRERLWKEKFAKRKSTREQQLIRIERKERKVLSNERVMRDKF